MYYLKIKQKRNGRYIKKQANLILNKSNITVKVLPGCGNALLKRKEIKQYVAKEKPLVKIWLILFYFLISSYIR